MNAGETACPPTLPAAAGAVEQAREHIEADLHAEVRAMRVEIRELKTLRTLVMDLTAADAPERLALALQQAVAGLGSAAAKDAGGYPMKRFTNTESLSK